MGARGQVETGVNMDTYESVSVRISRGVCRKIVYSTSS